MLTKLDLRQVQDIVSDDPVRPHITAKWRVSGAREVYALYEDQYAEQAPVDFEGPRAIICVAYTDEVPTCERDLGWTGTRVAVFYTVWSYDKGAGRDIVFATAEHIKKENIDVQRYVTLSPLTEMAERFHLRNGATFLDKHTDCQNFEYRV